MLLIVEIYVVYIVIVVREARKLILVHSILVLSVSRRRKLVNH